MSEEKPSLEDVLEYYGVQIKFGRVSFMTRCPLHEDKTPSLSVNIDKQVWNCKSCGEAGDSYTLIMKKEDTNFVGARKLAASQSFATSDAGGGDEELRGSSYGGGRKVSRRKGSDARRDSYVPRWRRG